MWLRERGPERGRPGAGSGVRDPAMRGRGSVPLTSGAYQADVPAAGDLPMPSFPAPLDAATLIGALAVMINGSWPLVRSRRRVLALQAVASLLFGLHYLLLGAATAAAMCAAGVAQGVGAALIRGRVGRLGVFGATVAGGLAVTAATWSGWPSLCAQGGQLLSAAGRMQRSTQALRWCFLAGAGFWVAHNVQVGSRWGLTSDALAVSMLTIGLWRGRSARRRAQTGRGPTGEAGAMA